MRVGVGEYAREKLFEGARKRVVPSGVARVRYFSIVYPVRSVKKSALCRTTPSSSEGMASAFPRRRGFEAPGQPVRLLHVRLPSMLVPFGPLSAGTYQYPVNLPRLGVAPVDDASPVERFHGYRRLPSASVARSVVPVAFEKPGVLFQFHERARVRLGRAFYHPRPRRAAL